MSKYQKILDTSVDMSKLIGKLSDNGQAGEDGRVVRVE